MSSHSKNSGSSCTGHRLLLLISLTSILFVFVMFDGVESEVSSSSSSSSSTDESPTPARSAAAVTKGRRKATKAPQTEAPSLPTTVLVTAAPPTTTRVPKTTAPRHKDPFRRRDAHRLLPGDDLRNAMDEEAKKHDEEVEPDMDVMLLADGVDHENVLFHIAKYLKHPDPVPKSTSKLILPNETIFELKRSLFSHYHLFDERDGSPRAIPVAVIICGGSKELPVDFHQIHLERLVIPTVSDAAKHFGSFHDCAHTMSLINNMRLGVGHFVVVVNGNTTADRQWIEVFVELERSFPARFTVFARPNHTCASNLAHVARLAFRWIKPMPDRIFFITPQFRPVLDTFQKFAYFSRLSPSYVTRFFDMESLAESFYENRSNTATTVECVCGAVAIERDFQHYMDQVEEKHKNESKSGGGVDPIKGDAHSCPAVESELFQLAVNAQLAASFVKPPKRPDEHNKIRVLQSMRNGPEHNKKDPLEVRTKDVLQFCNC